MIDDYDYLERQVDVQRHGPPPRRPPPQWEDDHHGPRSSGGYPPRRRSISPQGRRPPPRSPPPRCEYWEPRGGGDFRGPPPFRGECREDYAPKPQRDCPPRDYPPRGEHRVEPRGCYREEGRGEYRGEWRGPPEGPPSRREFRGPPPQFVRRSASRSPPPRRQRSRSPPVMRARAQPAPEPAPQPAPPAERVYWRAPSPSARRRSATPPADVAAHEKERELRELERATRTIFVYNLTLKVDERDLFEFFSKVGRVVDIKLITDKNTKKSRGLAYIEFSKVEEVMSAVALTGTLLKGQPVMVKASEAEKNLAWEAAQQQKQSTQVAAQQLLNSLTPGAGGAAGAGPCWLTVSNLDRALSEHEVHQLFAPFGGLESVRIVYGNGGRSAGTAHLHFASMDAAARAMSHWNGRKLMDAHLAVSAVAASTNGVIPGTNIAVPMAPVVLPTAIAPNAGAAAAAATGQVGAVVTTGELDEDEEGGGIRMSAQGRVALMSKLAGSAGLPAPSGLVTASGMPATSAASGGLAIDPVLLMQQGVLGPSSPIPTPCLMLKNMWEAVEPGPGAAAAMASLAGEVQADVRDECSRFGDVIHVWADPRSKGFVYLRFATTPASEAAHRALHGRWYGGRQIIAEYQFLQVYNGHFKLGK